MSDINFRVSQGKFYGYHDHRWDWGVVNRFVIAGRNP